MARRRSAKGDLVRALDSYFESGGEMPEGGGGGSLPAGDDDDDDDDEMDDGLDEEELTRAEAGAGSGNPSLCCSAASMTWWGFTHVVCKGLRLRSLSDVTPVQKAHI